MQPMYYIGLDVLICSSSSSAATNRSSLSTRSLEGLARRVVGEMGIAKS